MEFEAFKGAIMAAALMIGGFVIVGIISLIKSVFSKGKSAITEQIDDNIKPFINDKQREFKENKILKLKNLLDNDIISKKDYEERRKKIEEF